MQWRGCHVNAQHYFSPCLLFRSCLPRAIILIFYFPIRLWYFTKCGLTANWCLSSWPKFTFTLPCFSSITFYFWLSSIPKSQIDTQVRSSHGQTGVYESEGMAPCRLYSHDLYGWRWRWCDMMPVTVRCHQAACSKHRVCSVLRRYGVDSNWEEGSVVTLWIKSWALRDLDC